MPTPVQATPAPAFDLDLMLGGPIGGHQVPAPTQPVATAGAAFDPLGDIFGTGPVSQPAPA